MAKKPSTNKKLAHKDDRHVRVNAKYVAMLVPFISKELTRYYLNGIYVMPHPREGVILAATDGHVLAMVHDVDGAANGSYINPIPLSVITACKRRAGKKNQADRPALVHFIGDMAMVTSVAFGDLTPDNDPAQFGPYHLAIAHSPEIDATYPDFLRLIPDMPKENLTGGVMTFNPRLVAAFKNAADIGGHKNCSISIAVKDEWSAILVFIQNVPEFLGLLMPMRGSAPDSVQDWVTELKPKPKSAPKKKAAAKKTTRAKK